MSEIKNQVSSSQGVVVDVSLPFKIYTTPSEKCGVSAGNFSSHNQLAFDIADVFSLADNHEVRDKTTEHKVLENKLTTILHLLRFLLASQNDVTHRHQIKLSAIGVEWDNAQFADDEIKNIKKAQQFIFEFYPSSQLPWPIKRNVQVTNITGTVIKATFLPIDENGNERFAKWVFQLHRRSLQKRKN